MNLKYFFSSENKIKPKDNTLLSELNNKNIIFPEKGNKAKEFFSSPGEECFWRFAGAPHLKTQNFSYNREFINQIPAHAKKACFSTYNICGFWLKDEIFTDFYFIDPEPKGAIFETTTVLVSPQIYLQIKKGAI